MSEFVFPHGFLWGTAASAHQVEGNNTNNDWWAWEQHGRVREPSGQACDHYRRFREDFDLAQQLAHNAHRFSVEWSRVEPEEGRFSDEALAHYRDVVQHLRRRGMEPIVTLHHYTNPLWLERKGGWTNRQVVEHFARFARRVAEALGGEVLYWLTINEPMVYIWMHYLDGVGPPGEHNLILSYRVMEHLVRAHIAAYHAIHDVARSRKLPAQVSVAMHAQPFWPCRWWWPGDRIVAGMTEQMYNQHLLDALIDGVLRIPYGRRVRLADATNTLDFIGMNYYGRVFLRMGTIGNRQWVGRRCSTWHHREVTERNGLDWDIYPPGMAQVVRWAAPYRCPVLITENGICTADDGQRSRFILRHLAVVARLLQQGVPVLGYLYWSLLDNFEWAEGYAPRFGLIEVDYATQARRVRDSARTFAEVCRTNRLVTPN